MDINVAKEFIIEQFKSNQFFSAGALVTTLTGVAYGAIRLLKSFGLLIWSRIYRNIYYETEISIISDLYNYVSVWIEYNKKNQLKKTRSIFNRESDSTLKTEFKDDWFRFIYNNRLLTITSTSEKLNNSNGIHNLVFKSYTFSGYFAKKSITKLLEEILQFNLSLEMEENIKLYTNHNSDWWSSYNVQFRNIDGIIVPKETKEFLLKDIDNFIKNKEFYNDRNIPYRRGYLLSGPPGTGKSSLVSAIAKHFNRNLYSINLSTIEKESYFEDLLHNITGKSILLIEDIDGYFNGRENSTKVSFSTFINQISGVKSKKDVILFITTNYPDKIDEALKRSGRIDVHIILEKSSMREINEFLTYFYKIPISIEIESNISIADIENICIQNMYDSNKAIKEIQNKFNHKLEENVVE